MTSTVAPNKWKGNRREIGEDFFATPKTAILPIKPYIPEGVKTILEPTHGKGAISNLLEEWGYTVIKQDKYPKTDDTIEADFLTDEIPECDMIVFNPPFSLKTEFLKRACESGKPFIFICPVTVIETHKRFTLFREHKLSVLNLPNRTNYMSEKGNTGESVKGKAYCCLWQTLTALTKSGSVMTYVFGPYVSTVLKLFLWWVSFLFLASNHR